jgi:hypothetical protein
MLLDLCMVEHSFGFFGLTYNSYQIRVQLYICNVDTIESIE